jgi:hypothetical protein
MDYLFFWMLSPWDEKIAQTDWENYLTHMAWVEILIVMVVAAAIIGIYTTHASKLEITTNADLLRPYTPMKWLFLSIVAAVIAGVWAAVVFSGQFPSDSLGMIPSGVTIAFEAGILALAAGYFGMFLPTITPPRYTYRVTTWMRRREKE